MLATPTVLMNCVEAARLRYKEVSALMQAQLEAAEHGSDDMES